MIAHAILSGDLPLSDLSDHSSCLELRGISVSGGVGFGTAFVVSSAVDRNNAQVAELFQEVHPAVLLSLKSIATAAKAEGRSVGVCGEMAGDQRSALLLIAMGYGILSMNATNLLLVKRVLSNFSMSEAQTILSKVLSMDNSRVIQNYVEEQIRKSGLVGVLRTQK